MILTRSGFPYCIIFFYTIPQNYYPVLIYAADKKRHFSSGEMNIYTIEPRKVSLGLVNGGLQLSEAQKDYWENYILSLIGSSMFYFQESIINTTLFRLSNTK